VTAEARREEDMDKFKAQTFITNPQMYQAMFADTKETVEKEIEWVHPEEEDLAEIIAAMKEESGS
jgi:hypothetical protein